MGIENLLHEVFGQHTAENTTPPEASAPPEPATAVAPASKTPALVGRTLLIHGYSADGKDFFAWRDRLADAGIDTTAIAIGNYVTLNNEVSIKDLGEAFDRALRLTQWSAGGQDDTWTFDAIVHSTGMLVLRQWLTSDPFDPSDPRSRIRRLKHLIGFAPATFGSPQAKQGRSWLGALVKGNRDLGPDFLNAGNKVLDGLELASRYTWDLALKDMICDEPLYDKGSNTPYVAIFIGNLPYSGISAVSNSPGCDGTVRWAGCALNSRMVRLDLRRQPRLKDAAGAPTRCVITPWSADRLAAPMIAVDDRNHGTLLSNPADDVADRVAAFVKITDPAAYSSWESDALSFAQPALAKMNLASSLNGEGGAGWQQLLVHMVDDHGDPVTDYNLQLFIGEALTDSDDPAFKPASVIVDTYSAEASFRCFYIRLSPAMLTLNQPGGKTGKMWIELIASSGSSFLEYEAYTVDDAGSQSLTINHLGGTPAKLDITALAGGTNSLLYPYTSTLLEIVVERAPLPLDDVSSLFGFLPPH